ncbi:MAG: HAMP domain-containing sensor histidine kinase [Pseudohongiellaceae bacterium]|nr:HAMP domain-containing sensor histidine kinase [Pseudohongiellaceae bacterium]
MLSFRAQSIRQLTTIGFIAVATLLIAALFITARQLDGLGTQAQGAVTDAATAMSSGRRLIEQSLAMERNALQYVVLQDEGLYQLYIDRREELRSAVSHLQERADSDALQALTSELLELEGSAFVVLGSTEDREAIARLYAQLSRKSYEVSDAIESWIAQQQSQLRQRSEATKRTLTAQALLFIAAAFGLATVFIYLITRPLKQIDSAINRLGSGAYEEKIEIYGPHDLQSLGSRLEWLRERLCELEQHRVSFLRHVSHELKTPLASMQEGAALLHDGVVGPLTGEQREISHIIVNNCERLQKLIEGLLRHNSQNFDVLSAAPQMIEFEKLINQVIDAHQLAVSSIAISLQRQFDKNIQVEADAERLRVIIDNLFTNALKFSPQNGVIVLRMFAQENSVVFEILDQGPGVPKAEAQKIFSAFYQGSSRPARDYGGTGLGLAIAQEYAISHGGSIEILEQSEGACFRLTMPASYENKQK